jgi:hypothetical protein
VSFQHSNSSQIDVRCLSHSVNLKFSYRDSLMENTASLMGDWVPKNLHQKLHRCIPDVQIMPLPDYWCTGWYILPEFRKVDKCHTAKKLRNCTENSKQIYPEMKLPISAICLPILL